MQLLLFFARKYPGDSWRIKSLVLWVWGMDTAHKCLVMAGSYLDVVSGDAVTSRTPNVVVAFLYLSTSLVSVPVQTYFTWRIWKCRAKVISILILSLTELILKVGNSMRWALVSILAPCILFHFVVGILMTIKMWIRRISSLGPPKDSMMALPVSNLVVEAATDVTLAIGLSMLLWRTYLKVVSGSSGMQSYV
ncbi:hypothetical protein MD484_g8328, partial [Candolleomyces efflorescens]